MLSKSGDARAVRPLRARRSASGGFEPGHFDFGSRDLFSAFFGDDLLGGRRRVTRSRHRRGGRDRARGRGDGGDPRRCRSSRGDVRALRGRRRRARHRGHDCPTCGGAGACSRSRGASSASSCVRRPARPAAARAARSRRLAPSARAQVACSRNRRLEVSIPPGMSPRAARSSITRPAPLALGARRLDLAPEPPHAGQACVRTNSPKTLRDTCCSRPAPPHVGARRDLGSGLGAVAARSPHVTATWNGTSRVFPVAASTSSISTGARGRRRASRAPRPPSRSSPKNAEKRSERLPKSKWPGLEAAAAEAGVAVAVVELARLGLREHLVRLDDLAEALLRVGRVGDVGVQLARERAERLLDLALVGVARDAEQLVVVALCRCHPEASVVVDRLDEARQLGRGGADRAERLLVVHAHRAERG